MEIAFNYVEILPKRSLHVLALKFCRCSALVLGACMRVLLGCSVEVLV